MITVRVIGAAEVSRNLKAFPAGAQQHIRSAMGRILLRLVRGVKENRLTGQSLHVRTGRLRRSIHSEMTGSATDVTGIVGTNVQYAAAHEYGYQGSETVKAHLRNIKQAFGRAILPKQIMVSAHSRAVNLPERSFLRAELDAQQSQIVQDLNKAIDDAIGGSSAGSPVR